MDINLPRRGSSGRCLVTKGDRIPGPGHTENGGGGGWAVGRGPVVRGQGLGKTDRGLFDTDKDLVRGAKKIEDLNGNGKGGCNSGTGPNRKERGDIHGRISDGMSRKWHLKITYTNLQMGTRR